ncbi:hypothetical protein Hanom_Chr12g01122501 [Helianthus anomalus]
MVTQNDEGFNWDNYITKNNGCAMLAKIINEPEQMSEEKSQSFEELMQESLRSILSPEIYDMFAIIHMCSIHIMHMCSTIFFSKFFYIQKLAKICKKIWYVFLGFFS